MCGSLQANGIVKGLAEAIDHMINGMLALHHMSLELQYYSGQDYSRTYNTWCSSGVACVHAVWRL